MPGGSAESYASPGPLLEDIEARAADGSPCCAHIGPGGARAAFAADPALATMPAGRRTVRADHHTLSGEGAGRAASTAPGAG